MVLVKLKNIAPVTELKRDQIAEGKGVSLAKHRKRMAALLSDTRR